MLRKIFCSQLQRKHKGKRDVQPFSEILPHLIMKISEIYALLKAIFWITFMQIEIPYNSELDWTSFRCFECHGESLCGQWM